MTRSLMKRDQRPRVNAHAPINHGALVEAGLYHGSGEGAFDGTDEPPPGVSVPGRWPRVQLTHARGLTGTRNVPFVGTG